MRRCALGVLLALLLVVDPVGATEPGAIRDTASAGASGASSDLTPAPFDSATTATYRRTALALARAIATDDAASFRTLHTEAGWEQTDDWWKAMLANQKRKYGSVVRVVGPLRGVVRMGNAGVGIPRDGAAILLRLEKQMGASLCFTLDRGGSIVTSSLWVQAELADANPEGAEVLWEAPKQTRKKGSKR